jgi:hypothetical protein
MTVAMLPTETVAHSLQEINRLFGDEAIPAELVELTKDLEMTAGAKTIREQVHAKQHTVLAQYLQARTDRRCMEARTSISRLDIEIATLQERGDHEAEDARRRRRDDTTAFIRSLVGRQP